MWSTGFQLNAFNNVHHQPSNTCCSLGTNYDSGGKITQDASLQYLVPFPNVSQSVCLRSVLRSCPSPYPSPLASGLLAPGIYTPSLILHPTLPLPHFHPFSASLHLQAHLPALRILSPNLSAPAWQETVHATEQCIPRYAFSRFFFSVSIYSSEAALIFCTQAVLGNKKTERCQTELRKRFQVCSNSVSRALPALFIWA